MAKYCNIKGMVLVEVVQRENSALRGEKSHKNLSKSSAIDTGGNRKYRTGARLR